MGTRRFALAGGLLIVLGGHSTWATVDYAKATGKRCADCHVRDVGGGPLTEYGLAYQISGRTFPVPQRALERVRTREGRLGRTLDALFGALHLAGAVVWLGAIFFIHIFVGPRSFTRGIPRRQRMLGWGSMALMALTGLLLATRRVFSWHQLVGTTAGALLLIKVSFFLLMVALAAVATTAVHRRMARSRAGSPAPPPPGPGVIAFRGAYYDVSGSRLWRNGLHAGRHRTTDDLESALAGAPHGPELLERLRRVGTAPEADGAVPRQRAFLLLARANLLLAALILLCVALIRWGVPLLEGPRLDFAPVTLGACAQCHVEHQRGLVVDWSRSRHAAVGVECADCHRVAADDPGVVASHRAHSAVPVAALVSPPRCARCHPQQAAEYARSKHANTRQIMWQVDPWMREGLNSPLERATGCEACHGSQVRLTGGRPDRETWPNVGVGRLNPDGSKGSCTSCHTRHAFSLAEARKPEACDQCHLGPDHPQIEIYNESKHGTIYHAEGQRWNWGPPGAAWQAGRDYRAPTCAVCHISAVEGVAASHDVTDRLAWETQAPLTIRPRDFRPFPAPGTPEAARQKMRQVCLQCHGQVWADGHFSRYDAVVAEYNTVYFEPVNRRMEGLYTKGLLSRERLFDESLEREFYEFWHHEGRRARMGTAMMAPDYAWWHGFYELKHRYRRIWETADALERDSQPALRLPLPNATGPRNP